MLISLLSLSQIAWPGCTGVQSSLDSSKLYAAEDAIGLLATQMQLTISSDKFGRGGHEKNPTTAVKPRGGIISITEQMRSLRAGLLYRVEISTRCNGNR